MFHIRKRLDSLLAMCHIRGMAGFIFGHVPYKEEAGFTFGHVPYKGRGRIHFWPTAVNFHLFLKHFVAFGLLSSTGSPPFSMFFTFPITLQHPHPLTVTFLCAFPLLLLLLLSTPLHQRAASRVQHPNHVAAISLSPQVARKGSTLSGFVQRSRLEREVVRDLHSNKWEEV